MRDIENLQVMASYCSYTQIFLIVLTMQDIIRKVRSEYDFKISHQNSLLCYNAFDANQCTFLQHIINSLVDINEISNNQIQSKFANLNSCSIDTTKYIWQEVLLLKQKIELLEENDTSFAEIKKLGRNNKVRGRNKSQRFAIGRKSNPFQYTHIYEKVQHDKSNYEVGEN